jgi:hypothetical protein
MSSYTSTLKEMVDLYTIQKGGSVSEKIEIARKQLFDFDYPFFNENYRKDFETHFIRHFFMREIGFETEGLFKFNLETWLLIHMPYWNKVFESETYTFDPLTNTKINVSHDKTNNVTSDQNSSSNGSSQSTNNGSLTENDFSRELDSSNPDTRLAITTNNGQGVIEYASNIKENSDQNTKSSNNTANESSNVSSSSHATSDGSETFTETREGKTGTQTYAQLLNEYRSSLLRVEKSIFNEMNQLFMLVY